MHFSAVEPPVTLATYTPLKPPVHILPPTTLIPNSEPVIDAAILTAGECQLTHSQSFTQNGSVLQKRRNIPHTFSILVLKRRNTKIKNNGNNQRL